MKSMGRVVGLGMKILNQSNYRLWKSCMESYLVSGDLWDVVGGNSTTPPRGNAATPEEANEWTRKNAKAEFALKRSISSRWATQPSLEEFENLLASQESLAMQMSGVKINDDSGSA
uniref:DUF4219 domain-containing protein n=1 Tax=Brassica oleracea var. oleracea TaxID=109376 RepID=A0A0D3C2X7_BRAOL